MRRFTHVTNLYGDDAWALVAMLDHEPTNEGKDRILLAYDVWNVENPYEVDLFATKDKDRVVYYGYYVLVHNFYLKAVAIFRDNDYRP